MAFFDFLRRKPDAQKNKVRRLRAPSISTAPGGWSPMGGVERAPSALPLVRARARDLADNSPYGVKAVRTLTDHSIGSGVRYRIGGHDDYRAAFNAWAASTDCDFHNAQDLYALQATAVSTMISAGDVLLVVRQQRTPDGIQPTIQLIDPEQIDVSAAPKGPGNTVHQGVEINPRGTVVGYHVKASIDGLAAAGRSEFLSVDQAYLMFERLYPGQLRGIPRGASALEKLYQTDSFLSAAIAKARSEACLTVFLTTPSSEDGSLGLLGDIAEGEDDSVSVPEHLEPGAVITVPEGYDIRTVVPSGSGGLNDYIKRTIEAVSVGYGVLYYHISGDVTGFNYSSGKLGLVDFHRSIDALRSHTIYPALRWIERAFRDAYEITHDEDIDVIVRMVAPARESMEPAKEVAAELSELSAGLLTLEEAWLRRGRDPDEMWQALEDQAGKLAQLGMPLKFGSLDLSAAVEAEARALAD